MNSLKIIALLQGSLKMNKCLLKIFSNFAKTSWVVFPLILNLMINTKTENQPLRRIRETVITEHFYPAIKLNEDKILSPAVELKITEESITVINYILTQKPNPEDAIRAIRNSVENILKIPEITTKVSEVTQEEIARRQREARKITRRVRGDIQRWMEFIFADIIIHKLVNEVINEIKPAWEIATGESKQRLENILGAIEENFSIYFKWQTEDKIRKDIQNIIRNAVKDKTLVKDTFRTIERIEEYEPTGIWIIRFSEEFKEDARRFSYQFRVTVKKGKDIYSTEFILKILIPYSEDIDEKVKLLKEKVAPQLIATIGAIDKVDIQDSQLNALVIAQESLLMEEVRNLKWYLENKVLTSEELQNLRIKAVEYYLKIWEATLLDETFTGLMLPASPRYVSVWLKQGQFNIKLVNPEIAFRAEPADVVRELLENNYDRETIREGVIRALGEADARVFLRMAGLEI